MLTQARRVLLEKSEKVEEIKSLLMKYKVLGIADLRKVRAQQLQEIRKKLESIAHLKVYKNTLVKRAASALKDKQNLEKLEKHMQGSNLYIFTNYNCWI